MIESLVKRYRVRRYDIARRLGVTYQTLWRWARQRTPLPKPIKLLIVSELQRERRAGLPRFIIGYGKDDDAQVKYVTHTQFPAFIFSGGRVSMWIDSPRDVPKKRLRLLLSEAEVLARVDQW